MPTRRMRPPLSASAGFHSGKPGCFILTNVHFPVARFAPALDALRSRRLPQPRHHRAAADLSRTQDLSRWQWYCCRVRERLRSPTRQFAVQLIPGMTCMKPTIAIIGAGAMGSAVAQRLTEHGVTVLTSLTDRSAGSRSRAEVCGMRHADDRQIVERSKIILSIVPPADAFAVAERFAGPLKGKRSGVVFADCNAISVPTVAKIAGLVEGAGATFIDGAIIGPREMIPRRLSILQETMPVC
jgi:hypothetical protein